MANPKTRQVRIPIEAFVEDIRHGMTDRSLMKKYGITQEKTLLKAFDKLVDSGRVSIRDLQNRSPFINTQAIVDFLGNTGSIDEID